MTALLSKKNDVLQWTVDEVGLWLETFKMEQLVAMFKKHGIDGYTLL
jgi:hypothetical protein